MPFHFQRLALQDVILITSQPVADKRGFFMETYKRSAFEANGISEVFVQDNYSRSVRDVLRGLHYQKHPKAQGKLVGVMRGEIFEVAVDLRRGSPTYGHWVSVVLSEQHRRMLYVPVGFAHGFCVLSAEVDVVYRVTAEYAPDLERGLLWNDPAMGIPWPVQNPILSSKDAQLPLLKEAEHNFVYQGEPP